MLVNMKGKLVAQEKAVVSVFDHGLLYGDGVFEGIRAYNGRVFRLPEHMKRLYDSAKALLLASPSPPAPCGAGAAHPARQQLRDGYVRLVVTRGPGDLGLGPSAASDPALHHRRLIELYPEKFYEKAWPSPRAHPPQRQRGAQPQDQVAQLPQQHPGQDRGPAARRLEAILLTQDGYVAECTGDNLFILRRGRLLTPPTSLGALDGITRQTVLELARKLKIPAARRPSRATMSSPRMRPS